VDKVQPKKNRCVLFPSNYLHASSSPILNDRRLVINTVAAATKIIDFRIS
jgi:Rps23 Pro-64 3,4-dihydroxylase Tpa1-like proline 4-hydroxylase